jgi:uncharacterized protein Yka (UPF0111/DUF47 family)
MHLLPREECFFDFFEAHAQKTVEGCALFLTLARGTEDVPALCARIKAIESACDKVTHDTVASLHRVFITPLDRNDIYRLISRMDDVMDLVEAAVKGLRDLRQPRNVLDRCVEINRLENESDRQLADAIAHLFHETADPFSVIKWKEIFETVEMATDSCEDVANVIEGVVMESS